MEERSAKEFSDELKVAILNDFSRWALDTRGREEKSRRNLMFAIIVSIFISITGILPERISAIGLQFDAFPRYFFYLMMIILNCYFYWSYDRQRRTARWARIGIIRIYHEMINYDYTKHTDVGVSKVEKFFYESWRTVFPLVAFLFAVIICTVRVIFEITGRTIF